MRIFSVSRSLFVGLFAFSSFFLLNTEESYSQCSALPPILSLGSNKVPASLCSGATGVSADLQYSITFASPMNQVGVRMIFDWGDGTAVGNQPVTAGANTYNFVLNHTFPVASDCEYQVTMYMRISGIKCATTQQQQIVSAWRTDQYNGGVVQLISPTTGTTIHTVCEGVNISVVFADQSIFNCNSTYPANYPPNSPIQTPNEQYRWQQIVYNTTATSVPSKIPNVKVNGVSVTGAGGADILTDYQDPRGVFFMSSPVVVNDARRRSTQTITAAGGFGAAFPHAGDEFAIQLKYWNYCNPYDDPNIPGTPADPINGDHPATTAFSYIQIISSPTAPTVPSRDICSGDSRTLSVSSPLGAGYTYRWWSDSGLTNQVATGTSFTPGSGGGAGQINAGERKHWWVTVEATTGGNCRSASTEVTLTRRTALTSPSPISGAQNLCPNSAYTFTVPSNPPSITITDAVSGNFVLSTTYQWSVPGSWTINSGQGTKTLNITTGATTGAGTVSVSEEYTTATSNATFCTAAATTLGVNVWARPTVAITPDPANLCQGSTLQLDGSPSLSFGSIFSHNWGGSTGILDATNIQKPTIQSSAGSGSYGLTYFVVADYGSGVFCSSATDNSTVNINQVPPKPTISASGPTTFCFGGSVMLTSSNVGGLANSFKWYKGGVFTGQTTASITLNTVAQSGNYTVEAIGVNPTNCTSPTSNATAVTINPLPTAPNPTGGGAVCSGNPAPDIVWTGLTGTAPFNITYTLKKNGVLQSTFGPIAEPTNTFTISSPNPAGVGGDVFTYQITVLTDANTCSGTSLGTAATVTIGGTAPTFDTAPSLSPNTTCDLGASTTDPQLVFSLDDAGSANKVGMQLNYKIGASGTRNKIFNTNATGDPTAAITFTDAELNTSVGSPFTITIISIISPSGCQSVFNTPLSYTVNATPAAPTGAVNGSACNNPGTGVALSVNDPGVGFNIAWSTAGPALASFVAVTGADGTVSGVRNVTFTPTTSATKTYYAFARNTTSLCMSATGLAVTQTQDIKPTAAAAGPDQPNLCGTTATLAATAADNGGQGTWTVVSGTATISSIHSATSGVTGLVQDAPGGGTHSATLRWTVTSALGACAVSTDDVILTTNPLPTSIDPAPHLCEDVSGGGTAAGIDLTTYNAAITNAPSANVIWYSNAARTVVVSAPVVVDNVTHKIYYWKATSAVGCQNIGQITFTVDALPAAVDKNFEFCEDAVGAGVATGIDLTSFEMGAGGVTNGGTAATRDVEWYEDATLLTQIPPGNGPGQEQNYTIAATKTIYAKVIDLTSSVTPKCYDVADVTLTLKTRPADNPISGSGTVCTGSTIVLYQVDPSLNPGSLYTWNVSGTADFQIFGGGGTNSTNFFVLLKFPGPATGTVNISMHETLNGCDGNTSSFVVTVAGAPGALTFSSAPTALCKNQTGVVYSLAGANPLSLYTWSAAGATFPGASSGVGLSSVTIDFNTVTPVTVSVTETSSSGCAGSPANVVVNLSDRPSMTSASSTAVCSGNAPSLVFTSSISSTYSWQVTNITGTIGGTTVGNTGSGNLSEVLTNTSGISGTVTYRVTPTENVLPTPPSCPGNTQDVVVTVNPEPVLVTPQTKTICSGSSANYEILLNPATLPAGTIFNWPAPTMSAGPAQGTAGVNVPAGAAGTIHISDVLTNTTASPITATYNITPSAGGCPGTMHTVVITINPEPTISSTLDATLCSSAATGLTLATAGGSVAAASYNITARSIAGGLTPAGGNAFVPASGVSANYLAADAFTNTTGGPLIVTYTVQGVSGAGCVGTSKVITMTINPEPVISNSLNATVCSDDPIALTLNTNGTSVAAANYNITAKSVPGGLSGAGTNAVVPASGVAANYLAADSYTNTGLTPLNVTYTVVPVSAAGCQGASKVITITINPEPVVSPSLNKSVCSQASVALTLNTNGTSVAASAYDVTGVVIAPGLTAGGSNVAVPATNVAANYLSTDSYTNTGSSALDVVYTVVPKSAAGCTGDPLAITITINPEPVMSSTLNASVCSDVATGLVLNTNGTSVGAASYNITARTISGGLTAGGGNAGVPVNGVAANYLASDVFTNTGSSPLTVTYTVVPVSSAGCTGASKVITITINPEPVVSTTLDATVCSSIATGLTLNTNGSSVAAANYNITARTIAGGLTAAGGNVVVPASGVAAGYLASDIFTNTGAGPLLVTYTVVPVSASGCLGDPKVITITVNPEPVVATTLDATVCSDAAVGLTLNTNGTSVAAANFNIVSVSIAAGLTASATNAVIPASGVAANYLNTDSYTNPMGAPLTVGYTVQAVSSSGCVSQNRLITITINPEPVVASSLDATVCSDVTTGLTLATNGTSVAAASYDITSRSIAPGLTAAGTNALVPATGVAANYLAGDKFTNTGAVPLNVTYTVVPKSASGCGGDPKVITITINPEPVVANALDVSVCSDVAVGINFNTNGTSVAAASYNITARSIAPGLVANGSNAIVPATGVATNYLALDEFTNTGSISLNVTYTVVPVSAAGCVGDPKVITATIAPEPVVSSTLNSTICSDAASGLTLNTNGLSVAAASYNITAQTIAPGLTAAGTNALVPATNVAANYLATDKFTNTGASQLNVTYTVVPTSAAGCAGDPLVITLTINPEPVLSGALNNTVCSDIATGLVLATNGTSVAAQNYNITAISVGPGLTAAGTNAVVPATGVNANYLGSDVFTNTGPVSRTVVYTVVPVSSAGCQGDPVGVTITINPEPVVSTTLDETVCSDIATGLMLNTNGASVAADHYNILSRSVAGGLVSGGGNAAVPMNGVAANYLANDVFTNTTSSALTVTYTVVPVSLAGCLGDSKIITVTINPEPVVATGLDVTVCSDVGIGLTLNTNGTSVAAASYNVTAQTVPGGLTPAGTNVGVPASAVASNYLSANKYTNVGNVALNVTYTVVPVSASGCLGDPKVITITINPEPVVANGFDATLCSDVATGLVLNTNGTSVAATDYNITSVSIAGGLTPGGSNAVVPANGVADNYLASDSYTNTTASSLNVSYTVIPRSGAGCLGDAKVITFTINPEPVIATTLDATVCSDVTTGLVLSTNGASVAAASYNVTSIVVPGGLVAGGSNAVVANGVTPTYLTNDVFTNTGNSPLNVLYTVVPVSGAGCLGNAKVITITINPEPVVATTLNATVCSDIAVGLTLNTNGTSVAASSYNITARTIAPGLTAAITNAAVPASGVGTGYLAADKFTNTGPNPLTVVYSVVPVSAAGCVGDSKDITITINPEPVLASGLDKTVCSDNAGGITLNTNGTSVAAANYNVTAVSIPAGLTPGAVAAVPANGVAANYLANDTYTNTGNAALDVSYTVVPVSAAGCLGDPLVIKQTVNPEPVLANLDKTICSDATTAITLTTNGTSVAAANYNVTAISIAGGLVAAGGNAGIPGTAVSSNYIANDSYTNTGNSPLNVQYTVVPISALGCHGDPVVITVTISPEPVLSPTLNATVCSDVAGGITLNTNGTSVAAATYNITSIVAAGGLNPKAGNASVANGVTANYIANDAFTNTTNAALDVTYTVVPVSATGCQGDPLDVILTINPEPVVDPALASETICSRAVTGITLNTNGASVAAANYNVSLVSQDAGLTGTPTTGNGLANSAIQNDNFVNVTTTPLKVVYQVVPVSAAGCLGDPFTITITINAEPVINPALDNTVCSRDISGIILSTNGTSIAAASYTLESVVVPGTITANPSNVSAGSSGGINLIKSDKYTNTTASPVVVTYEITGTSPQGCKGPSQFISLTINPEPILDPSLSPAPVCSDVAAGVTLAVAPGSVAAASYNINNIIRQAGLVAGGSNASIGPGQASNAISNDTYTNTTSSPLTVTYKVQPVTAAGCLGTEQDVVFTINPAPAVATNLNKTVCSSAASGIVLNTSGSSAPAAQYEISAISVAGGLTPVTFNASTPRTTANINEISGDQFQNLTNGPLTVTYTVVAITGAGCRGPSKDIVLTVDALPTVIPDPEPTHCSNTMTSITLNSNTTPSAGNITFSYAVSASSPQVSGFVPLQNNLPAGYVIQDNLVNASDNPQTVTYTITPYGASDAGGAGCAGTPLVTVVNIEPKPQMTTASSTPVCEGTGINIPLTSTTVPSSGSITFELTSVSAGPVTGTSAVGTMFNNGNSLNDVLSNPTTVEQQVTYTFLPHAAGVGCDGTPTAIVAKVNPLPNITAIPNQTVCSGESGQLLSVPVTVDTNPTTTLVTWTVTTDPGITGPSPGAGYNISQVLFNSTSAAAAAHYTVKAQFIGNAITCNSNPNAHFNVTVNPVPAVNDITSQQICNNTSVSVPLASNVAGSTFAWTVSSNSVGAANGSGPTINQLLSNAQVFAQTVSYSVKATAAGCTSLVPEIFQTSVDATVTGQFITSDPTCVGIPLLIQFGGSFPYSGVVTDGTNTFNLTNQGPVAVLNVTPTSNTNYTLTSVTDGFGCSATPNDVIQVGVPKADFTVVSPAACSPSPVDFKFNQVAGTQYTWNWIDGTDTTFTAATDVNNKTISHTFVNPAPSGEQQFPVMVSALLPQGCIDTKTQTVTVYGQAYGSVVPSATEICSGTTVIFTNQSQGVSDNKWFYRQQGTTEQKSVKTTAQNSYTLVNTSDNNPITYEVVFQGDNGHCPVEVVTPIVVYRAMSGDFSIGDIPFFEQGGANVTFTNTSNPKNTSQFDYNWNFGDNSTPETGNGIGAFTINYGQPGLKTITLNITNIQADAAGLSCNSTVSKTITILVPPLVPEITYVPQAACFPADIEVTKATGTGDLYEWQLLSDEGKVTSVSTAPLPLFSVSAPGSYTISLKTTNSLTGQIAFWDNASTPINIYPQPVATFEARPQTLFVPDTELKTFNFTTGATQYAWNFGDSQDTVFDEFEPSHFYQFEGKYTITLVASNDHGDGAVCKDTVQQEIVAREGGETKVPNAFTPSTAGPNGGTAGAGSVNDVFLPVTKGVVEFKMQIYDRWGTLIFESNDKNIGWDGYDRNGNLLPGGVYVYKLTMRLADGARTTKIGDVTLIR